MIRVLSLDQELAALEQLECACPADDRPGKGLVRHLVRPLTSQAAQRLTRIVVCGHTAVRSERPAATSSKVPVGTAIGRCLSCRIPRTITPPRSSTTPSERV